MKGHTACALACHSEPSDAAGFELLLLAEILVERRGNGLHSGVHATAQNTYMPGGLKLSGSLLRKTKLRPHKAVFTYSKYHSQEAATFLECQVRHLWPGS